MTNPITRTRTLALAALFSAAALLAACGGGGGEVTVALPGAAPAPAPAVAGAPPAPAQPFATPTLTITGPSRAIANTRLSYQAVAVNATPTGYSWNWGDGTPNTAGSPAPKVWNKTGNFVGALSASVGGTTLTGTASVAVVLPIAVGYNHTCILKTDTTVACRGLFNNSGQLGNGTTTLPATSATLVAVSGLTGATAVTVGYSHSCALKSDGTVVCWGRNRVGELGDGTEDDRSSPVQVLGLSNAVAISGGGGGFTCAVKANGTVMCWGQNSTFELGNGTNVRSSVSIAVTGLTDAVAVSTGANHSCAVRANGTVVCWGYNGYGGLGDGTQINSAGPVAVLGLTDVVAVSASNEFSCALKSDGTMRCWGSNSAGQLGDGTTTTRTTTVVVSSLSNVIGLGVSGNDHSCALKSDGTVACWGYNARGSVGDGTTVSRFTPVAVLGVTDAVAISSRHSNITCAVNADSTEVCWGR